MLVLLFVYVFFDTIYYIFMLVLFFVYIFFRTKQCHFECSLHLKKEIDLCKLARQYNEAERLNKRFVENTFDFSQINYLDHCASQIFYNYSDILFIRYVFDNL